MAPLLPLLDPILNLGGKLIDRLWPNPEDKARAQLELLKMQQDGDLKQLDADLQLALAQAQTNTAEAASGNPFASGWRPFVGWVCGAGLLYQLLARPLLIGFSGHDFPPLEIDTLMTLLFGLLGLGAYRTAEKIKGVVR